MKLTIIGFGIAKDILNSAETVIELPASASVSQLRSALYEKYPEFKKLRSLAVAVNSEYAQDDQTLDARDEVVLIPPVSGG